MIPRNINPNRAIQIAINGRDQLLQIPSGCFNLTDDGIECTADDISVFAPWESIQWLEQSNEIDSAFNYDDNANANNYEYIAPTPDNPFNDANINKTLLKKCLQYGIIIKDDRTGYFRVKFSNQILGRTMNEILDKINHNLKLKAFLIQESETMDNDTIMNAYNDDSDDSNTDDADGSRFIEKNRHNERYVSKNEHVRNDTNVDSDDVRSNDDTHNDAPSSGNGNKSSYITEEQLRKMIGDEKYNQLRKRIDTDNVTASEAKADSNDDKPADDNEIASKHDDETAGNDEIINDDDDDEIIIDDGFEDYDDNDNNLVMNEPDDTNIEKTITDSDSEKHDANTNAVNMIPKPEDQTRDLAKPSRRKFKNDNASKPTDTYINNDDSMPSQGFGMQSKTANKTVKNNNDNNASEPEHLTAYRIEDNTSGNADTKDEQGYDYVILFTCDGFIGSIESRWKDYESALSKCNELNNNPNVKQSLVHIHYSVYRAKGSQLVNRKYQVLTADGLPDSSFNEYGEKIKN